MWGGRKNKRNQERGSRLKGKNKYLTLFVSTLTLSAFTFGGGYVIVSLRKRKFVDELHWLEENEMLDMTAIAQSCPGAVAVNAAILVGHRVAGFWGTVVSVIGTVIPPFVIIGIISFCYDAFRSNVYVAAALKGMESGIAAVIADVTVNLSRNAWRESKWSGAVTMALAFCASWFFDVNVLWIILVCGMYGAGRTWLAERRKRT